MQIINEKGSAGKTVSLGLGIGTAWGVHHFFGIGSLLTATLRYYAAILALFADNPKPNTPSMNIIPKQRRHLLTSDGVSASAISLLGDRKLDTLALWQRDPWLLGTDDENVALTGSERVVYGILDVDNVETSIMALTVSDDTNTTHVTTTSDHSNHTSVELDVLHDLAGRELDLDGVVDLDGRIRVTDATQAKFRQHFWGNGEHTTVDRLQMSKVVRPKLGPTAE